MKTLLFVFAISSITTIFIGCNRMNGVGDKQVKFMTHKEAADTLRIVKIDSVSKDTIPLVPIRYGYIPAEDAAKILREARLQHLIISNPADDAMSIYNGFYGADHYRIEFFIHTATADSSNPFVIMVTGKSRYKKNVTPFTGHIMIDSAFSFKDFNYDYSDFLEYADSGVAYEGDTFAATIHLKGSFEFTEDSSFKSSGLFKGKFFADLNKFKDEGYRLWYNTKNETRRAGILMDGTWANYSTHEEKPVIAARDIFMFANDILENFSYGEREIEINEKYRAIGWDDYWENEEWWAAGEKQQMSIWGF